ncbi:hypothetical protein I203_108284 [Kwoniella mangroviensis CBS 8507]|uniref:hypothetical protein n=1 Tax=Kwoniella mangroviensis CBS 8507 TaxID=1296122 RepID=UPI00080CD0B3|nr:uncharacterized protein I203_05175 [Kwoniella mangroviensis CBS 8507]OCF65500.1 hypothetical protein I203_05175 [Kwoniella mangroviensis CBS 8507]
MATLMDNPSRVMIANALGYMSIGSWLCAQLPQVIKNASLKSCEGLALPFLCSWLFGDMTNLIGCLLTDQLPFQTYLAIYFCTIDLALVGQYIHYSRPSPKIPLSAGQTPRYVTYNTLISSPHQSLILPPATAPPGVSGRARSSSGHYITSSVPNTARPSRGKRTSTYSHLPPPDINVTSSSPADGSYAAIYEAALDVARAAERASHRRRSRSKRRKLSRQASTSNVEEDLADSFHSELSHKSSSIINGGGGGSPRRMTQSTGTLLNDNRGRSITRSPIHPISPLPNTNTISKSNSSSNDDLDGLPTSGTLGLYLGGVGGGNGELQKREHQRSQSRSLSLVRGSGGRGGRRAAGVAFMSLGLLVGWGGLSNSGNGNGRSVKSVGRVLVESSGGLSNIYQQSSYNSHRNSHISSSSSSSGYESSLHLEVEDISGYIEGIINTNQRESPTAPPPHPPDEPPSFQRIVGRVSAWACTTLYLASRLPQIWKNFQRKSVEGLSILLFVMAFMGNVTYVSSILLNPAGGGDPNEAGHYLLEALPYLLGSGGTLIFDMTIMIQSVIYGSSPPQPIPPTPMERSSRRRGYLASKRKLKHVEDGFSHPHLQHVRTHSYTQQAAIASSSNQSERTPLLPPPNIHNSLGIETNRSRSRSKSPEKTKSGKRTVDHHQGR